MRPVATALIATLLVGLLWTGAQAQAQTRHARVAGEVRPSLAARVRGQTADLDWSIVWSAPAAGEAEGDDDRDAIVWFLEEHETLSVYVWDPRARRELRADLERAGDASARDESAALVVRSALEALELGPIGVPVVTEAESESPRTQPVSGDVVAAPTAREPVWLGAALGGFAAIDGMGLPYGGAAELSVRVAPFVVTLSGRVGLLERLEDPRVSIERAQHRVALGLSLSVLEEGPLRVALGLDAGAVLTTRTTLAVEPTLVASAPSLIALPSVGLSARASVRVIEGLAPWLEVGAELSPTLAHRISDELVRESWPILARLVVGLTVETVAP